MCEGGTVVDLVNGLLLQNKRMKEEHIGYILKELIKVYIIQIIRIDVCIRNRNAGQINKQ